MLNGRYLIGAAVEQNVVDFHTDLDDVEQLLERRRPSVDDVHAVRSQRLAPDAFAYKCEVDFDGTWVAAQLYDKYAPRFKLPSKKRREAEAIQQTEVPTLLSYFAEDVVRVIEREVRDIERAIRARHPDALFIEIEPDAQRRTGSSRFRFALDEGLADESKRSAEQRLLDSYLSERKGVAEALPVNFAIKDGRVVRERRKAAPASSKARLAGVAEDESRSYRKDGLTAFNCGLYVPRDGVAVALGIACLENTPPDAHPPRGARAALAPTRAVQSPTGSEPPSYTRGDGARGPGAAAAWLWQSNKNAPSTVLRTSTAGVDPRGSPRGRRKPKPSCPQAGRPRRVDGGRELTSRRQGRRPPQHVVGGNGVASIRQHRIGTHLLEARNVIHVFSGLPRPQQFFGRRRLALLSFYRSELLFASHVVQEPPFFLEGLFPFFLSQISS